ncbi:MAG: hypothetical protein Q8P81_04420 [Nanoarchaeota archaeon]|nr:hypothetical protein [Nanoarchaeota archaeon]
MDFDCGVRVKGEETDGMETARLIGEYLKLVEVFSEPPSEVFEEGQTLAKRRRLGEIERYLSGLTGAQFLAAMEHYRPTERQLRNSDLYSNFKEMRDDFGGVARDYHELAARHIQLIDTLDRRMHPSRLILGVIDSARASASRDPSPYKDKTNSKSP